MKVLCAKIDSFTNEVIRFRQVTQLFIYILNWSFVVFSVTCLASKSVCGYISDEDINKKDYRDGIDLLMFVMNNKSGNMIFL